MTEQLRKTGFYLVDRLGVPTFLLVIVLWFVGTQVVQPLVSSHADYLRRTAAATESMAEAQASHAKALDTQSRTIDRMEQGLQLLISRSERDQALASRR